MSGSNWLGFFAPEVQIGIRPLLPRAARAVLRPRGHYYAGTARALAGQEHRAPTVEVARHPGGILWGLVEGAEV